MLGETFVTHRIALPDGATLTTALCTGGSLPERSATASTAAARTDKPDQTIRRSPVLKGP